MTTERETATGPPHGAEALSHVRICDMTGQLAGAGATRLLAAYGAEVIRVEDPTNAGAWDLLRVAGPFPQGVAGTNRSTSFNNHNVGKLGVSINLRTEQGKQLLTELIGVSDVVTENFAAGVFTRLGFPYEVLKGIREDVIYVSNCGFGSWGPYSNFRSWGPIVQAFSGAHLRLAPRWFGTGRMGLFLHGPLGGVVYGVGRCIGPLSPRPDRGRPVDRYVLHRGWHEPAGAHIPGLHRQRKANH